MYGYIGLRYQSLGKKSAESYDPITLRMVLGLSIIMMMSRKIFVGVEIGQKLRAT